MLLFLPEERPVTRSAGASREGSVTRRLTQKSESLGCTRTKQRALS